MRRQLAGPGTAKHQPGAFVDPGKMAPGAHVEGGGFRRGGDAAGPTSSFGTGSVADKIDTGKYAPAAGDSEHGYRGAVSQAAGPAVSGSVADQIDTGKFAAAAPESDSYRPTTVAAGPASSHGTGSVADQIDTGKFAPAADNPY